MENQTNKARSKRILEICDAALELEPDARIQFISDTCGDDQKLYQSVLDLIGAVDESNEFLVPDDPESGLPKVGDTLGSYRLLAKLGSGGMGTVFRAERLSPGFDQQVAVKLINATILTPELTRRFNAERELLARLRHPYIAGLIDGGTTDAGVPFLVMELVDGVTITEFCNARRLTIAQRLALVKRVALAIQHAHNNLVVHRDLKPTNVLVTTDGIPKLLDFGVAKLLSTPETLTADPGATTLFGQQALTPDYASPEQIRGMPASTSQDVYALGLLTYELLTGCKAQHFTSKSAPALLNELGELKFTRITEHFADGNDIQVQRRAKRLRLKPARAKRLLQGDVETLVATAMHFDADRRYHHIGAFIGDLNNYQKGLPLAARGDSLGYRAKRLLSRHRLAVSVLSAVIISLSIGLAAALWQSKIAQKRFTDIQDLSRSLMGEVYDAVEDLPGSTPARNLIVSKAQMYLDGLAANASGDVALSTDLAKAYRRLGDVLGLPSNGNLGNSQGALESYDKALDLLAALDDQQLENRALKAFTLENRAEVLAWQGNMDEALQNLAEAKSHQVAAHNRLPSSQHALRVAQTSVKLGDALGHPSFANGQRPVEAQAQYREALDLLESWPNPSPSWEWRRYLGLLHERLGTMALNLRQTSLPDTGLEVALQHYVQSMGIRGALSEESPQHMDAQRDYGVALEKIADVYLLQDRLPTSVAYFEKALKVYEALAEADPTNASAQRTLAYGYENLAQAIQASGDHKLALANYRLALELREALVVLDANSKHLATERDRTLQATVKLKQVKQE